MSCPLTEPGSGEEPVSHACFTAGISVPLHTGHVVVATGVDLKNSLCITGSGDAAVSAVTGNINTPEVYQNVSDILNRIVDIDAVVCDLHPDLHSTRLAEQLSRRLSVPLIQVQHHHAHIAAVLAECTIERPVIGLAMDGYGYGSDGSAWGGECLYVDGSDYARAGHLRPVAMPGGDAASLQPWRMAVAWLNGVGHASRLFEGLPVAAIDKLCRSEFTPVTTSAGRLFDAASAIVLGSREVTFEGEAAMALEKAATGVSNPTELSYRLEPIDGALQLDCGEAIQQLVESRLNGEPKDALAAGFHQMLADGMAAIAIRAASEKGVSDVVLAGGCFLNALLKGRVIARLEKAGLQVILPQKLACGDGAIALGQAWVAVHKLKRGDI